MYRHMVIFNLASGKASERTTQFLSDAQRVLSAIPGVKNFLVTKQASPKSNYNFCFSMDFGTKDEFNLYSNHPEHNKFVSERWEKEVTEFLEIDLLPME